ncbi:MAG: hypothetical protein IOD12_16295 [Silvanigrellales bacterium]|nr:hypothetical protein [Silvanigrellales bacterium]
MRREIFLFDDFLRLKEFLGNVPPEGDNETPSALGVGFFSTSPLPGEQGVGVQVAPPFLESAVRSRMAAGHAAPYSREVLLFGDDSVFQQEQSSHVGRLGVPFASFGKTGAGHALLGISRWLMAGVHPGVFRPSGSPKEPETWPVEVAEAACLSDAVHVFLQGIYEKVMGIRPMSLVFLLETGLLARYFNSLSTWKKGPSSDKSWEEFLELGSVLQEKAIGNVVLAWLAEEGLHPRVAVVCRSPREHESLLLHSHWSLVKSPSCANVLFRL